MENLIIREGYTIFDCREEMKYLHLHIHPNSITPIQWNNRINQLSIHLNVKFQITFKEK